MRPLSKASNNKLRSSFSLLLPHRIRYFGDGSFPRFLGTRSWFLMVAESLTWYFSRLGSALLGNIRRSTLVFRPRLAVVDVFPSFLSSAFSTLPLYLSGPIHVKLYLSCSRPLTPANINLKSSHLFCHLYNQK